MKLFPTVPLWSQVDFITEKSPARDFRVSLEDIESGSGRLISGDLANYDTAGIPFEKNDILFGKLRPYLAKFYQAKTAGTAGGDIHIYRPLGHVDPRFLFYVISSKAFISHASVSTTGVKMPRTDWSTLRNFHSPSPSFEIQRSIADHLDRETSEIDAMLDKLEGLRKLLEQRRITTIKETVSKDDTALEFPSAPIAAVANISLGKMLQPRQNKYSDCEAPYIHAANIKRFGNIDINYKIKQMWFTPTELSFLTIEPDDVVVVEGGAVGQSAVFPQGLPGWAFQNSIVRVRPHFRKASGRFINYALQNAVESGEIDRQTNSATIAHFTAEKVARFRIPLPPIDSQLSIANYLDQETAGIDAMLAKTEKLKDLLVERRSALITATVTGQIEVN